MLISYRVNSRDMKCQTYGNLETVELLPLMHFWDIDK